MDGLDSTKGKESSVLGIFKQEIKKVLSVIQIKIELDDIQSWRDKWI